MKYLFISIEIVVIVILSSCFNVVEHNHANYAFQAQKFVIEAIALEDQLNEDGKEDEYISLMKKAVQESKYAKRTELNGLYKNWGDMFHDYLIIGAKLTIEGYNESDAQISFKKFSEATDHIIKYSDWFNEHASKMEKELEKNKNK